MDAAQYFALQFRSQIEQIETYFTEQLGEQIVFSEGFRERFINDVVQAYIHRDAEELTVRRISHRDAEERKREALSALAENPPPTLECYTGLLFGQLDPYENQPQFAELCFRLPDTDSGRNIATVRTRDLVQDMHDVSGWTMETTEDQVVVDSERITSDTVIAAAREWLTRFYPPLAECHLVHLSTRDVVMLELENMARYAGHESLASMVRHAQREIEER